MLFDAWFYFWIFVGISALILLVLCCVWNPRHNLGLKDNAEVKKLRAYVEPNQILTASEKRMHNLLVQVVPSKYHIMCQVAFTAFIKCDDMATRNSFSRLRVDWLICTEDFTPILALELDDDSHRLSKEKDIFRDNLLSAALIPTERFNGLPKSANDVKHRLSPYFKNNSQSAVFISVHQKKLKKMK